MQLKAAAMLINKIKYAFMIVADLTVHVKFICVVICEPPCVQGACVANDTCNCVEGYIGERCTEPGQ